MNVIPGSTVGFTPGASVMRGGSVARAVRNGQRRRARSGRPQRELCLGRRLQRRGVVLRMRDDVAPRADEGRGREERRAGA